MQPSTAIRKCVAAVTALAVCACTSTRRIPPTPPHPVSPATPTPAAPTTWTFHYAAGTFRYTVRTDATIEQVSDSVVQPVPVTTTASYALTFAPSSDSTLSIAGVVDSFVVLRGAAIPMPAPDSSLQLSSVPFSATMNTVGGVLDFQSPATSECDSSALSPIAATARELLIPVPPSFTDSTQWQDSTSTTICRDGIPVTTVAVHRYRVAGQTMFDSIPAIQLTRTSSLTMAGNGTPRYRTDGTFSISGTGMSSGTFYIDPRSGILLGGSGSGEADVTVTTAQGSLPFHQRVTQTITRQP